MNSIAVTRGVVCRLQNSLLPLRWNRHSVVVNGVVRNGRKRREEEEHNLQHPQLLLFMNDVSTTSTRSSSSSSSPSSTGNSSSLISSSTSNSNSDSDQRCDEGSGSKNDSEEGHSQVNCRIVNANANVNVNVNVIPMTANDCVDTAPASNELDENQQQQQQQQDPNENLRLLLQQYSMNDVPGPRRLKQTSSNRSSATQNLIRSTTNSRRKNTTNNNNKRLRRLINELSTNTNQKTNTTKSPASNSHDLTQFFLGAYSDRIAIETIHQTTINHGLHFSRISKTEVDTIFHTIDNDDTITTSTSQDEFWKLLK